LPTISAARNLRNSVRAGFRRPSMAGGRRPRADTPLRHKHQGDASCGRSPVPTTAGRDPGIHPQIDRRPSLWRSKPPPHSGSRRRQRRRGPRARTNTSQMTTRVRGINRRPHVARSSVSDGRH
jgi:hypothetical protein